MQEFYGHMAEVLEVAEAKPNDVLKHFAAWDSLTVLSIIAMLDSKYGVRISGAELHALATLADLEQTVAARLPKA